MDNPKLLSKGCLAKLLGDSSLLVPHVHRHDVDLDVGLVPDLVDRFWIL